MQTIDLTQKGDSYKVITFPDGEVHSELAPLNRKEDVAVRCRVTNAEELFILLQVADILKRQCMDICVLEIYYLMGMRCDRLFDVNRPFTLKIVADMINSIGACQVYIYEPHSDRVIRMINNAAAVKYTRFIESMLHGFNDALLLVAPDEGAALRYGMPFAVTCSKVRDVSTGKLINFKATENVPVRGRDLLMIDDLCDGGGTFMGLAPKVRELEPKSLSLLVTHAIQKAGIEKVASVYDKVYITNTYKEWNNEGLPDNVTVYNIDDLETLKNDRRN